MELLCGQHLLPIGIDRETAWQHTVTPGNGCRTRIRSRIVIITARQEKRQTTDKGNSVYKRPALAMQIVGTTVLLPHHPGQ